DIWSNITIAIIVMYAIVLVFPLVSMLKESFIQDGGFSLDYFSKFFGKKYYYSTLFNSLKVTFAVTLAALVIAVPLSYVMTTFKIKGKLYLQILILISSMAPPFIGAYAWIL